MRARAFATTFVLASIAACGARNALDLGKAREASGATGAGGTSASGSIASSSNVASGAGASVACPPSGVAGAAPACDPTSAIDARGVIDGTPYQDWICLRGGCDASSGAEYALAGDPGHALFIHFDGAALGETLVGIPVGDALPLDARWFCSGAGSSAPPPTSTTTTPASFEGPLTLINLRALGTCADAPSDDGTFDQDSSGVFSFTHNGVATQLGPNGSCAVSSPDYVVATHLVGEGQGEVMAWADASGNVVFGMARLGDDGPDPGAVYCITEGFVDPTTVPMTMMLKGLRRLGTCAGAKSASPCDSLTMTWPMTSP